MATSEKEERKEKSREEDRARVKKERQGGEAKKQYLDDRELGKDKSYCRGALMKHEGTEDKRSMSVWKENTY